MSESLKSKRDELKSQIENFPDNETEPNVRLLFSGNAVKGSKGIKTSFISRTMRPFQELVKTQTSLIRYNKVGKRGKSKSSKFSELYLTALPTGSFGVELSQIEPNDLFADEQVALAIQQVIHLIDAATNSDEAFEEVVGNTPTRNLNNLRSFLKQIDEEHSILKLDSGSTEITISKENIHQGFERVNGAIKEDEEVFINGTLRGIFLDSAKFEFTDENGFKFSGLVNNAIPEELLTSYINEPCFVHLRKSKTKFKSGREKTTYELLEIGDIPSKNE